MQVIIRAAAWLMTRVMGASEAIPSTCSQDFLARTESRSQSAVSSQLTKSELMCRHDQRMAHIPADDAGYSSGGGAIQIKSPHCRHHTAPGRLMAQDAGSRNRVKSITAGRVRCLNGKGIPISSAPSARAPATASTSANVRAPLSSPFIAFVPMLNAMMGGIQPIGRTWPGSRQQQPSRLDFLSRLPG